MIALSPRDTWEFILPEERESDSPTVFGLRSLTLHERNDIADSISVDTASMARPMGTFSYKVCKYSVQYIRNIITAKGEALEYKLHEADKYFGDDVFEMLPLNVMTAIALDVWERSQIGKEELKN